MIKTDTLIINDIPPIEFDSTLGDIQQLFNQLTYSHIPIYNKGTYLGCVSENDVHCFEQDQKVNEIPHIIEGFYTRKDKHWLDILENFVNNQTNILPVLDEENNYCGYFELKDIIQLFNDTPFLNEPGGILVVEKGFQDFSFSEIAQIVESNNAKLFGAFVSEINDNLVHITLKIGIQNLNDVLQTFRRYSYNIITGHEEDSFIANLKERSKYLDKYLNI